jgi:hypothetical protein
MDKYTRKQLVRWENKKEKFRMREEKERPYNFFEDYNELLRQINNYNPVVTDLISQVIYNDYTYFQIGYYYTHYPDVYLRDYDDRLTIGTIPFSFGLIKMDTTKLDYRIDIPASLEALKAAKYKRKVYREGILLMRQLDRIKIIKDELLKTVSKFNIIRNCKTVKEELMATVWHPDRVKKILKNYGWEVYDNLLGVE